MPGRLGKIDDTIPREFERNLPEGPFETSFGSVHHGQRLGGRFAAIPEARGVALSPPSTEEPCAEGSAISGPASKSRKRKPALWIAIGRWRLALWAIARRCS